VLCDPEDDVADGSGVARHGCARAWARRPGRASPAPRVAATTAEELSRAVAGRRAPR
jgi:hypothetical protein